jgi:hypothetical protein
MRRRAPHDAQATPTRTGSSSTTQGPNRSPEDGTEAGMSDTVSASGSEEEPERRVDYMPLGEIGAAPRNPKRHAGPEIQTSLARFGVAELPLLDERTGRLVAGHGRLDQLAEMRRTGQAPPRYIKVDPDSGEWLVPVQRGWASADDTAAEAYLVASNHLTTKGGWDRDGLGELLVDINAADPALLLATGFTDEDLAALLAGGDAGAGGGGGGGGGARLTDDDDIPEKRAEVITRDGDLWLLGPHRLVCGDTTDPDTVARLFDGTPGVFGAAPYPPAVMMHADPPYGMGKEADGVANDNLYGDKLDAFQQLWWSAWREHWAPNGSAYVWGNAPDLWRWWWAGGLSDDAELMVRNEIVWDKETAPGMRSAGEHSYVTATERCLLVFRGQQFLANQNKDEYWEGNEPLRLYVVGQIAAAGWTNKDVNRLTGTHMAGHWTGKSQFHAISRHHYDTLRDAAAGRAFPLEYDEMFAHVFPELRAGANEHRRTLSAELRDMRTYFDNAHDVMTDVWRFGRVVGEERFGHATPKPVAMCERAMLTSSRPGDVIGVPFAGTGPEFIAGDHLGRVVVAAEITPAYVDIICRRYQAHTGVKPERVRPDGSREPVDFGA